MSPIKFSHIAIIYNDYLDSLYSYGISFGFVDHIVMDAIHDVFYKLCTHHSSLNEIENVKFYLFRSLRNRLIDLKRTNREFPSLTGELPVDFPFQLNVTVEDDITQGEDTEEIRQKINNFLKILTPRQREIIYLRYMLECSYEEIAEIMQISIESSRNLVSKSLTRLKEVALSFPLILLILK